MRDFNREFVRAEIDDAENKVDLESEWNEDYHLEHATELSELLRSMENESVRKPEMEKDAVLKANKIHEEVMLRKGDSYQKTVEGIASLLNDGGVSLEIPNNVIASGRAITFDYLMSKCLNFDYRAQTTICELIQDGIFDVLGLEKEKRPELTLLTPVKHALVENNSALGHFNGPKDEGFYGENLLSGGNGRIRINLFNFGDRPDIRNILETLEHECFHAYQFNSARGNLPTRTVRDRVMMAAYIHGRRQYISSKNDFEGYYDQGYESSARRFANQLRRATETVMVDAMKQAMEKK